MWASARVARVPAACQGPKPPHVCNYICVLGIFIYMYLFLDSIWYINIRTLQDRNSVSPLSRAFQPNVGSFVCVYGPKSLKRLPPRIHRPFEAPLNKGTPVLPTGLLLRGLSIKLPYLRLQRAREDAPRSAHDRRRRLSTRAPEGGSCKEHAPEGSGKRRVRA